jgi:hypothetical protein
MNSFPKIAVLAACAQYGPLLKVPAGLDGERVMIAIAAVESGGGDVGSVGHNCGPRHEPAYESGGARWAQVAMAPLLAQYPPIGMPPQSPAACSYGPWQMMFLNFQRCYTPAQLESGLEICASEFVRWFNQYMGPKHPQNLAEIGEIWNVGHITPDPAYTAKLQKSYDSAVKKTASGVS